MNWREESISMYNKVIHPEYELNKLLDNMPEPFSGRTGTNNTYDPDTINRKQLKARRKKAKRAKKAKRKNRRK